VSRFVQRHPAGTLAAFLGTMLIAGGVLGAQAVNSANIRAEAQEARAESAEKEKKIAEKDKELAKRNEELATERAKKAERDKLIEQQGRELAELKAATAEREVEGQSASLNTLQRLEQLAQNENYYQAALAVINTAIQESEQFWKPYLIRAKHQATFGKHDEAETDFEKAQELFRAQHRKESVEIWFEAGMYYGLPEEIGGRGLEDMALQYFEKAFAANPEDSFGKLSHTVSLIIKSKQNPEKAEEWLPQAIEIAEELTADDQAKGLDATWLVYAWALGASVFAQYDDNPAFLKNANFEEAKDALLTVVSEDKGDVNIRNFLAAIHSQIGEHDKAIQIYSTLLKFAKRPHIFNNRGVAYTNKGDLENAIADFKQVLISAPSSATAHLNLGIAYFENNQLEQALDEFNLVIQRLDSDNPDAYVSRGNVYRKQKNYSEARQDYQTAIRLSPKHDNAHVKLGIIHAIMGEWRKAFEEYDLVIQTLNPKNPEAYYQRGTAYLQQRNLEKALQDFNETLRLKPTYLNALINRGFIYGIRKNWQSAIQDLESAVKINPADGKVHNNLAFYYSNLNKYEEAETSIRRAIELGFPLAYVTHGEILMKKGDYDAAEQAFKEAYKKAPQHKEEIDRNLEELKRLRKK
jgi:tetratricopeptide (TPR) repeat protein